MESGEELFARIQSTYDELPRTQKKIADFVCANVQEVIFFSISELAAVLQTSEAALVRFAQNFGYSGFPQLRKVLIQHYKERLNPADRIKSYLGEIRGEDFIYPAIVRKRSFDAAVRLLCGAQTIFIYGSGPNESLSDYLSFRLNRFRRKTVRISDTGKHLFESFILMSPKDCGVVYAFYKSSSDVEHLLKFMKDKGIPSILITDTRIPPMVRYAQLVISASRGPFGVFHSPVVPMTITNALIIAVAERMGNVATDALKELSEIRQRYYSDELPDLFADRKEE
jgi:DNA-binding MurR/RpiR family transcriptional regulator